MPTIRTVFQPDVTREVHDDEAAQLEREGLLLPLELPATPAPAAASKTSTTAAKEVSSDGDKQAQ